MLMLRIFSVLGFERCYEIEIVLSFAPLSNVDERRGAGAVERARLESVCTLKRVPRVRIPPSPLYYAKAS